MYRFYVYHECHTYGWYLVYYCDRYFYGFIWHRPGSYGHYPGYLYRYLYITGRLCGYGYGNCLPNPDFVYRQQPISVR